jgi:hypothetical protein
MLTAVFPAFVSPMTLLQSSVGSEYQFDISLKVTYKMNLSSSCWASRPSSVASLRFKRNMTAVVCVWSNTLDPYVGICFVLIPGQPVSVRLWISPLGGEANAVLLVGSTCNQIRAKKGKLLEPIRAICQTMNVE